MNLLRFTILIFILLLCNIALQAQEDNSKQVLRGKVVDNSSDMPVVNTLIELLNHSPRKVTYSAEDGSFRLEDVPVGRHRILVKAEGYQELLLTEINVSSGKEVVLILKLDEVVKELVERKREGPQKQLLTNDKMRSINTMATISTRSFTIDEVRRYAGGLNDPARLASSFPGIFNTDDSQNYIISRGNSPFGIRYQIDGIQIDNPNHFPTLGNTGSPLPIINPNVMDNSDFLSGAFPAEYGNAFSGIFDIHLRNGNNQRYEFTAQAGLLGLEATAEGPFKKGKSSFMVNYRYSLFGLVGLLGLDIGTSALPTYQDMTFKLNFPETKSGDWSIFGLGGFGKVSFMADQINPNDIFAEQNRDLYLDAGFGLVGARNKFFLNKRSYIQTTLSTIYIDYHSYRDSISFTPDSTVIKSPYYDVAEIQTIPGISTTINTKLNRQVLMRNGVKGNIYLFDINDRYLDRDQIDYFFNEPIFDAQGFSEFQIRFNKVLTLTTGVFGQYMSLNKQSYALEPRVALSIQPSVQHRFALGYGWHSKFVPFVVAFHVQKQPDGSYNDSNRDLGFIRSHHIDLEYNWQLSKEWRFKTELYTHYLTNIPVESVSSSYSLINYGTFSIYPLITNLQSTGKALNYGLDLTFEKFFSEGFYGHIGGSYFRSKYLASDDVWRNSGNDVQYIFQLVGGKEFKIGKQRRNVFMVDFRFHTRGGRPYIPIDLNASIAAGHEVRDEVNAYSVRTRAYMRGDLKIGARINARQRRIAHYFYLDLLNATDLFASLAGSDYFKNDGQARYNPTTQSINMSQQFGVFPTFLYQVQF